MIINHNIAALNTHRQMGSAQSAQMNSMEKLSSGLRINSAKDDAAGLSISEKMRGQIRGLDQASRNAQDGISLIQTAEGALNETHDILQRMRELATQASNDTNNQNDRGEIQKEINQLTSEINRIGSTTSFNTKELLNGAAEKTAATSAVKNGSALGNVITIRDTATNANAVSSTIIGNVELHNAKGASVQGGASATAVNDTGLGLNNITIDNTHNELTLKVDGVTKTIALNATQLGGSSGVYDGSTAGARSADLINNLNTDLTNASAGVTASIDATTGKLKFTTASLGSDKTVEILGSGGAEELFGTSFATDQVKSAGLDANNVFSMDIGTEDDVVVNLAASNGTYTISDFANVLKAAINTATATQDVNVTVENGKLKIENATTAGSAGNISDFKNVGNTTTLQALGLANATTNAGQDVNNTLNVTIDGETPPTPIILASGDYSKVSLADHLQTKINEATNTASDVKVSVGANNGLEITSGSTGSTGSTIAFTAGSALATLGVDTTAENGGDGSNAELKFQIGANKGELMSITISDMRSSALKVSSETTSGDASVATGVAGAVFTTLDQVSDGKSSTNNRAALDVSTVENATAAIEVFDKAIQAVSSERSKLGSFQNRLEHTINNLGASSENLTAAESRIRDVDMAKEMMTQTKNSILAQAAQAMLAQANQAPQQVLQLLR